MKTLESAAVHPDTRVSTSRRSSARLLSLAPVALLLSGLFTVWAGSLAAPVVAISGDWAQFRYGPTHEGYNTQEHLLSSSNVDSLGVAWTGAIGSGIDSSPAVADGVVYVGSFDGKLSAFAVGCAAGGGTCSPLWTGTTGDAIIASPAVANGVVYVGSFDGKLYAFAVGCNSGGVTCTPQWTGATGNGIVSSPTVANGVVYVGSNDDKLYAFDAAGVSGCRGSPRTCYPLWTGATGGHIDSSPAVADGVVYVGSEDGKLYAYAAGCNNGRPHPSGGGTCTPLWTGAPGGLTRSSPAVADGVVYVGSGAQLFAFAVGCASGGGTCSPLWTGTMGGGIDSSPAVADGVVYLGSNNGKLYAFAVGCASGSATCSPLWTGAIGGAPAESSPAVANGVVYVGSSDGKLHAFAVGCRSDGGTCSSLWTGSIGASIGATSNWVYSSPAIANGVVYTGSEDGNLYAFGLPAPATTLVVSGISSSYVAGVAHSVTVTAKNASSHVATGYRGTIQFTSTDAKAVLPADYTFTAADAGVHVFSIKLKTAGSQAVRARDTVTSTITGLQSGIVVTAAAAKTLVVSGIANPYVAGVAHSVVVTAKDAYGNTATGYRGTIGFVSTDTQALLPANYTFTAGDKGVHKFSLGVTLKTAGSQSVRARDTVTSTITGGQYPIVVKPAAATTLVVSGLASPRTAGVSGIVTVTARDAYGNTATGYLGTVHFTSTDSKAVLPANYTFTAANAGVHTFSVTLKSAGTQAVRARDTVSSTITGLQSGIVVNPAFVLQWRDDFTGTAGTGVSASSWLYDTGTSYPGGPANWGTGEVETMTSATTNVYQDGASHLVIKAVSGSSGWTSGRIESKRTDFQPPAGGVMRVEARIQLPNLTGAAAQGYWPALWMLGAPYRGNYWNWPGVGEIDVMENVNGVNTDYATLHCGVYQGGPCKEPSGLGGSTPGGSPTLQSGFHTFAVEIDFSTSPEEIRWYLDGVIFKTITASDLNDATAWADAVHHGFFVILDLAMGGGWAGAPTASTASGGAMLVDYVAVYYKAAPPAP